MTLDAPWGEIKLDENRNGIADNFVKEIVPDTNGDKVPDVKTIRQIPGVEQTFGGTFTADTPAPDRTNPKCEKGNEPAVGRQRPRRSTSRRSRAVAAPATSAERAEPILRLRGVGRRFGGVHAVRDVDLEVRPGERRAILGPNGAGKTTLFNLISGEFPPTTGSVELFGVDVTRDRLRASARGWASRARSRRRGCSSACRSRTTCTCRSSASRSGHFRLVAQGTTPRCARRPRAWPTPSASRPCSTCWSSELSHGEQRQLEVGDGARERSRS